MSIESSHRGNDKLQDILQSLPQVRIFLSPIAPPAALGLTGFACSTFITSSYIANWWGNSNSPTIYFPFVGIFGGLVQIIAGIHGFQARDTLVTVVNTMWGSFWFSIGILYAFVVRLLDLPFYSPFDETADMLLTGRRCRRTPLNPRALPRTSLLVRRPQHLHLVRRSRRFRS